MGTEGDSMCLLWIAVHSSALVARKRAFAEQAAWGNSMGYRVTNEVPHSCSLAGRAYSNGTRSWGSLISELTCTWCVSTRRNIPLV